MSHTRLFLAMSLILLVAAYAAYTSPGSMLNAWVTGQCFAKTTPNVCHWHEKTHRLPNERVGPPPRPGRVIVR